MYNTNYMEGVPVKIAEKYKPPPAIYKLPQHLTNKLNMDENFYWNSTVFSCDLHLEKEALPKIDQWKRIRQHNKEQRRERILRREEQRKRENEDKQKALLYCVSYPSTDDLSSEEEEKVELNKGNNRDISATKEMAKQISVAERVNSFHNILQPTVLSFNNSSIPNNDITPAKKSTFDIKISNSFNYKDFEEDTSSPFDNIELKTINDLDVLAQVLHNTQVITATNEISGDNNSEISKECHPGRQQRNELYDKSCLAAETIPIHNCCLPQFTHDSQPSDSTLIQSKEHHLISGYATNYKGNLPTPSLLPIHKFNEFNNLNDYENCRSSLGSNNIDSINIPSYGGHVLPGDQIVKSKSVPDIVKELKDDIRNAEIPFRNCSYNMEQTIGLIDVCSTNKPITKTNDVEDIFLQLDCKAQQLVRQISVMGFPLQRVARTVHQVGTDDKKVIEHLIPLTELVDLGFDESKISDALIRNKNDKNKALDDLIS